jgi:hypothetical protein
LKSLNNEGTVKTNRAARNMETGYTPTTEVSTNSLYPLRTGLFAHLHLDAPAEENNHYGVTDHNKNVQQHKCRQSVLEVLQLYTAQSASPPQTCCFHFMAHRRTSTDFVLPEEITSTPI